MEASIDFDERAEVFLDLFFSKIKEDPTKHFWAVVQEAKIEAGYSPNTRNSQLVNTHAKRILERCQVMQVLELPKALSKVSGILDDPTQPGAKNALAAAEFIANRAGLVKKEQLEVEVKAPDGILIIPAKNKDIKDL